MRDPRHPKPEDYDNAWESPPDPRRDFLTVMVDGTIVLIIIVLAVSMWWVCDHAVETANIPEPLTSEEGVPMLIYDEAPVSERENPPGGEGD